MSDLRCRIATRRSPLAMCQAEWVAAALKQHFQIEPELLPIQTQGDQMLEQPLSTIGGKGVFIKELESSLLRGEADLAVHSMKDVPAQLPSGLEISAISVRADPRDAVLAPHYRTLDALPPGSRVGTSSLRRRAQLQAQYPDLCFVELRGNVGTRIKRLEKGDFDAIVLARAGLERLGLDAHITQTLSAAQCLPAIGQGALGIEIACDHEQARNWAEALHDSQTAAAVTAERAISRTLQGSCQIPLAGYATCENTTQVQVRACLARPDGSQLLYAESDGAPEVAGEAAAHSLLEQGGGAILKDLGVPGFA